VRNGDTRNGDAPLEVRGAAKSFGATRAVDAVDLTLDPGERLVLVGPSGCGKSTLLRLVAGLLPLDAGEIAVDGQVVDDGRSLVEPERRPVGLVFQDHALFPHMTIGANVAFGLRRRARAERRREVDGLLAMVDIAHLRDRYPHEVSGGERQRASLARAVAPRPRLLLLDEPFASLDPNLRAQVRAEVVALLEATETPAVFVSHDQAEAMALGDRVAVMRAGRIEQLDTPQAVYDRPANRFVAGFMGDACFVPVEAGPAGLVTELGPIGCAGNGAVSDGAVAVVRPADVTFEPADDGPAEVVAAAYHGATWTYQVRLASGAMVRSVQPRSVAASPGDRVRPVLAADHRVVLVEGDPTPAVGSAGPMG
jgi:iron(III) transport system ATP-binding protein